MTFEQWWENVGQYLESTKGTDDLHQKWIARAAWKAAQKQRKDK